MVGWHHWLDGREIEQAPGVGDGRGSLACYSPWSHKELDMTEQPNWTELTLCDPMDSCMPGFPAHHQLPELAQTHIHWVSDAIQPSGPLLLLPSIFPSVRVFSNGLGLLTRWPEYWSFSFCISPSSEYSGSISFGMDWLDLAIQGTLCPIFLLPNCLICCYTVLWNFFKNKFLLEYNWFTMYCTLQWICSAYTYIHSFPNSFSIQVITEYWIEFPGIPSRSLLVINIQYCVDVRISLLIDLCPSSNFFYILWLYFCFLNRFTCMVVFFFFFFFLRFPKETVSCNIYLSVYCFICHFYLVLFKSPRSLLGGAVVKNLPANARNGQRSGLSPGIGKILQRRKWQSSPVLLPGKSHGQRSLVGHSPWGCQGVGHDWAQLTFIAVFYISFFFI